MGLTRDTPRWRARRGTNFSSTQDLTPDNTGRIRATQDTPFEGGAAYFASGPNPKPSAYDFHLHAVNAELASPTDKLTTCFLPTPSPCITCTYPILSSLLSSTPPRHEYTLNGTWRSHRNLPCGLSSQVFTQ